MPTSITNGHALYHLEAFDDAITAYRKALAITSKVVEVHISLGNALRTKGDLGGAIIAYHKASNLDRKDAVPYGALGLALLQQGHFAEARRTTRHA